MHSDQRKTPADPDNEATFMTRVIRSNLREAVALKEEILAELGRFRFDTSALFGVKLALEEALTNAVKHGNRCDESKPVTVRYAVNNEKAVIAVRDEGEGFIPESVPDCTQPERLSVPNGRGILLMRAYMDEVCYRDQGREVYFVKRRKSSKTPPSEVQPSPIRRTYYFIGRVQGVGFRVTAERIAARASISGFVRNLSDGRVELVAEGRESDLDCFQSEVEKAMAGNIGEVSVTCCPPTGEFCGFSIRH